jgi:hypothetical protein
MLYQYVRCLLHSQEKLLKDYQMGPWFEGFTFIKRLHREKIQHERPKLPETSQHHVLVLSARLGELEASKTSFLWVLTRHGEYLLAPTSCDSPELVKMAFLAQKTLNQVTPSIF